MGETDTYGPVMRHEFEPAHGEDSSAKFTVELQLRPVAWAIAATFFATVGVGGIATYTLTSYTPETDLVWQFYQTFNPCIFFDHYPAKIFSCVGMALMDCLTVLYSLILFLYSYTERRLCRTLNMGIVVVISMLVDLMFINIFTTNLYPEGDNRRLHGAHETPAGTPTVSEKEMESDMSGFSISEDQLNVTMLHTSFYAGWVLANCLFMCYVLKLAWATSGNWPTGKKIGWIIASSVGLLGMALHASTMIMVIMHKEFQNLGDMLQGSVQQMIWNANKTLLTGKWGFLPVFYYRLIMPSEEGVAITFRTVKTEDDHGEVSPRVVVSSSFQLLAMILCLGTVLHGDIDADQTTTYFKLASVLRSKPYAYWAAPAYLFAFILWVVGLNLSLAQRRMQTGEWPTAQLVLGSFISIGFFGGITLIVEQERSSWAFLILFFIAFMAWVLLLGKSGEGKQWITATIYCTSGAAILCSVVIGTWYFEFLFLVWLCLYPFAVPQEPDMFITLQKLTGKGGGEHMQS